MKKSVDNKAWYFMWISFGKCFKSASITSNSKGIYLKKTLNKAKLVRKKLYDQLSL